MKADKYTRRYVKFLKENEATFKMLNDGHSIGCSLECSCQIIQKSQGKAQCCRDIRGHMGWFGAAAQIEVFQYFKNRYSRTNAYSSALALNTKKAKKYPLPLRRAWRRNNY